jgi:hypothetical protein
MAQAYAGSLQHALTLKTLPPCGMWLQAVTRGKHLSLHSRRCLPRGTACSHMTVHRCNRMQINWLDIVARGWMAESFQGGSGCRSTCPFPADASLGKVRLWVAQINWLDIVALGKRVESFLVWSWLEEQTLSERRQKLQEVMDLLTDGTLRPPEGASPPPRIPAVLQTLMKRQQKL